MKLHEFCEECQVLTEESSSRFWTGAGPCVTFWTNYVCGREGHVAVWLIAKGFACVCRPLLSVGLIARQRHGTLQWGSCADSTDTDVPLAQWTSGHTGLIYNQRRRQSTAALPPSLVVNLSSMSTVFAGGGTLVAAAIVTTG